MKICVLASGSEGNVTYVEFGNQKLLIDLGKNLKYIKEKLLEIGVELSDITAVIISHTHSDHTSALSTFIKKSKAQIFITNNMVNEIVSKVGLFNYTHYDGDITFGNDLIRVINSSHDAIDSKNFIIESAGKKICYITDTGYINRKYFELLKNLDLYLFESNHDVEMLMNGPYPSWLKKRVVGSYGHLSNKDASIYLAKFIGSNTKQIVLMHLSKTNNNPELAMTTINEVFQEYGIDFKNISWAAQNNRSEVYQL